MNPTDAASLPGILAEQTSASAESAQANRSLGIAWHVPRSARAESEYFSLGHFLQPRATRSARSPVPIDQQVGWVGPCEPVGVRNQLESVGSVLPSARSALVWCGQHQLQHSLNILLEEKRHRWHQRTWGNWPG